MASLAKRTRQWVAEKLITPEQASALLEYEKKRFSLFSLTNVLLFLGVFALGCGVCALVAANWQDIPDAVKLGVLYLLTAGTAAAAERQRTKNPAAFELLLTCYMLLLFAVIGLNGQIFHLVSDSWKAFMFWSFLAFPLLFLTQKIALGWLWSVILLCSFAASPYADDVVKAFRPFGTSGSLFFSFLSYAVFLTILPVRETKPVFLKPLCFFALVGAVVPLVLPYYPYHKDPEPWTLVFVSVYGAAFAFGMHKMMPFDAKTKKLLTGSIVLYILSVLFFSERAFANNAFLTFAVQFAQILLIVGFACYIKERRMFNTMAFVAASAILFRFLNMFETLIKTGFGLILTGVVLILAAKMWIVFMKKMSPRFDKEDAS